MNHARNRKERVEPSQIEMNIRFKNVQDNEEGMQNRIY